MKTESITAETLLAKYRDYTRTIEVPWRHEGGVLLVATPSGMGVREDGVGRLHALLDCDFVVGRDEPRLPRFFRDEAKRATADLLREMKVPRDLVVGRKAPVKTTGCRPRDCKVNVADGRLVYPKPFVVYVSEKGNLLARRIVEAQ